MDYKALLEFTLKKSGAFEDFPFGPEPTVVKVGSKMFAIFNVKEGKCYLSLKCDPFIAETLRQQYPSVKAGYHLNKQHWNTVTIDGSVPDSELVWMVDHSYDLVFKTLNKIEQSNL